MSERAVRSAIRDALVMTGAFDTVSLVGLPEVQGDIPASAEAAASVQPGSTRFAQGWDAAPEGGRRFTCQLLVTVLARHADAELCDELAEILLGQVRNAIDGRILVEGFNMPQKTMASGWQWQPRVSPERRIAITVTYDYIENGWNHADTAP